MGEIGFEANKIGPLHKSDLLVPRLIEFMQ